ncbi:MAG: ABC transporter ATP-binding protein [Rhodoluna sp.]|jgi:iron complex transport system ATP-binding protein|nr:ABC transporter ATP-binding protein [Rhodoluna sp.]
MNVVLKFEQVSLTRGGRNILTDISWQVEPNQRWVIVGPNGAGKTTLLRIASTHLQPSSGTVQVLGRTLGEVNVFELRTRIGFASTAIANRIPNSEKVLDAVMTASYAITGRFKETYDEVDIRRAKRVLGEWQLAEHAERPFGTLSDGERKRTQIARAVMPDPELLLLDEPVASLDIGSREATIKILGGYASHPDAPAIIMVTHHLEEIPTGFTHALILKDGKISASGPITQTLTTEKLSEAYGIPLEVVFFGSRFAVRAK